MPPRHINLDDRGLVRLGHCKPNPLEEYLVELRVAMDATYQRQPDGGISRYARQLTAAIRARGDVKIVEIGGGPRAARGSVRRRAITLKQDLLWHTWLGTRRASATGADLYHVPGLRGPLLRGGIPTVVTIHDVVAFIYPELIAARTRAYTRATQQRMARTADLVVCNSGDTANDVVRLLGVSPARVRVTPLGIDAEFLRPVARDRSLATPYVLFVGSEQPRKNLERLERAVGLLRAKGFPHELVTAGADSWGSVRIGSPFLRRLGEVSDEQLRQLYANAACLAIPSLHEGFGLPALEAMAIGTPVVAARAGALPEVTGGAAVLVDPFDVEDIAHGLEAAITSATELREAGRARASQFTWERTAAATVQAYLELS